MNRSATAASKFTSEDVMTIDKHNPLVILVLGMPGSGKTTLAREASKELCLPLIVKDDLKIILFDVYGWKNREESKRAGAASYKIMSYLIEEQLRCGKSLIVESTFNPKYDDTKFRAWQDKYHARYVQVYCYADGNTIRQRFSERATVDSRHVSHIEGAEGLQNLENYIQQGINPLNMEGTLIKVDTTDFSKVDESGIIEQLKGLM